MASKLFIQIKRYRTECSLSQILQSMTTFNKVTFSSDHGTTEFRAGDCVSLSCDGAQGDCSSIDWLFRYNNENNLIVEKGKVQSEDNKGRLHVTRKCSLEVKLLRKEDEGLYVCQTDKSSEAWFNHAQHKLALISKYLYFNLLT